MVQFDEERQKERLDTLRKREEEELSETMSARYGIPYLDLSTYPINIDALRAIKEADARDAEIAVFNSTDKRLDVAVLAPENPKAVEAIENLKKQGYTTNLHMVSHASLERVWDRYKDMSYSFETKGGALDISNEQILEIMGKVNKLEDVQKLVEEVLGMKRAYRISRILEIMLAGAIALKASDVHLEPADTKVRLRYRLDGVLTDILHFDLDTFELLLSRIKIISELKLNVKGRAQDGRFSIKLGDKEIEVRTSLLPGPNGESVVMRILDPNAIVGDLEHLNIHPRLLKRLGEEILKPNGMILTTGPTGSGKTTTLYAFLRKIYTPDIKVVTIENPIEYHLDGIVQTQTNEEYTFAEGLRSALRQDPDVIMVGEIRDSETATTAVNAALTGHLVLSTLHTNNAAGSFPRLLDLGVNSKVVSSALNVSMAQRLVRMLCDKCKKEKKLEGKELETVSRILAGVTDPVYLENVQRERVWEPVGCSECNNLGFKSRIGIHEAIFMDKQIEDVVNMNPSEREIREAAKAQKLLTLEQDGVIKVLNGRTSLAELDRVVDISSSDESVVADEKVS